MSKPRKYTKGIIIEPLMDTNGHEYHFFNEAVSLIIYISCVSCFSWLELFCHFRVHSCAFVVQKRLFVCFVLFVVPE